ncbi:MAG: cytochrome c-type biogenesis protein CcsB [Sulfurimonas sp.]|jgi:cytochrome c-type biogenesis protein CcsB
MSFLSRVFFSFRFVISMLFILGLSAGIATFIENDYDAQTAKVLVYSSMWYELVMISLAISLLGIIYKRKMYKKPGAFIFHIAFVVILIGAGVTRYVGYEGVIHIREGNIGNKVISEESYLQINTKNQNYKHHLMLGKIGNHSFSFNDEINGKELIIKYKDYQYTKGSNVEKLKVDVLYDGKEKEITILGGHGSIEAPSILNYDDIDIELSWGSKLIELPFKIELVDFVIQRYPGSSSPSSYSSDIVLIDGDTKIQHNVFMNHPLTYKGYKFFQSSYDKDEQGTLLSVNNDPGKWPTYFGYFLLALGLVSNFFAKGSRFSKLRKFLVKSNLSLILPLLLLLNASAQADTSEYINKFKVNSLEHSKDFGYLLVQDYNGRIKPMSTESIDVLHKMSFKESLLGMNATQIMLGIIADPKIWEEVKLVRIKNQKIKEILGLNKEVEFISFNEVFDERGTYKFNKQIDEANEKQPSQRGTFDKDLIKLDERLNIFYLITQGMFSKIIPKPNDPKNTWFDPQNAFIEGFLDTPSKDIINRYLIGLQNGFEQNNWTEANIALKELKELQIKNAGDVLPSKNQINIEALFNKLQIFKNLVNFYLFLGIIILIFAIISIFFEKNYPILKKVFFYLLLAGFLAHTAGLMMRWYVTSHAPWTDTYESLIYVGWSTILAGLVVFRKSLISLCAASILGGVIMLVAHLNFISPQITTLVPVLNSYWLSIHVSVITGSYGFLGLGALLGFMSLMLMIFRTDNNKERLDIQIRQLTAVNEISLIIGLSLLTIGNFMGGIWANESWGRYWGWDPKETWAFVSIVVYSIVLHIRFIPKLNSVYVFSIASVVSFSSIIMTYFGVNFYLSGLHSYASGDKIPVPSFVYYMAVIVLIISISAYRGRGVKVIK